MVSSVPLPAVAALPPPVAAAPASVPAVAAEPANTTVIKSPMVGTFYAASSPDSPPFAKVGDTVSPEKTVCLIEAMKVYNEIQAECSGVIVAVLAKNGETVEFGKPLFRVAVE
jgi:acetyl-CoA carboxylase biotin carboxyl carrier protein